METTEDLKKLLQSKGLDEKTIDEILAHFEIDENSDGNVLEKLIEQLPEILKTGGISSIITSLGDKNKILAEIEKEKQVEIQNIQFQNLIDARKFLKAKYWQDIIMVGIIMSFIFILSYSSGLEKQSVGTLIGAIIGYALGRLKGKPSES